MSATKSKREKKRQLGQFLTPIPIASDIVDRLPLARDSKILEPSFGDGSFLLPLIDALLKLYKTGTPEERVERILNENIWGSEIDPELYARCLENIATRYGIVPKRHNLVRADFFRSHFHDAQYRPVQFDIAVGNPPFGGTFDPDIEDDLDAHYGSKGGEKIKKETYAFFIVKSLDLLKRGGVLTFICSDTFLTIQTMRGLRAYLMNSGDVSIERVLEFSEETTHPMVVLRYIHDKPSDYVRMDGGTLSRLSIERTANLSFGIRPELEQYFAGPRMGDFFCCNEWDDHRKERIFCARSSLR